MGPYEGFGEQAPSDLFLGDLDDCVPLRGDVSGDCVAVGKTAGVRPGLRPVRRPLGLFVARTLRSLRFAAGARRPLARPSGDMIGMEGGSSVTIGGCAATGEPAPAGLNGPPFGIPSRMRQVLYHHGLVP